MNVAHELAARRNSDGGFGPIPGAVSEPEPTALAAIALADAGASAWLERHQAPDGSVGIRAGQVFRDLTSLASIAMTSQVAVDAAITWVERAHARNEPSTEALPHDPTVRGWPWTADTFGWAEPTAWSVLALRRERGADASIADGIALLRDRECVGGGWNYGNRIVLDEDLPAFVQTTALVSIALAGLDEAMAGRGLAWLGSSWRSEADGLLSVASAAAALRLADHEEAVSALTATRGFTDDGSEPDTIALAWAAIALGDGVERLGVS